MLTFGVQRNGRISFSHRRTSLSTMAFKTTSDDSRPLEYYRLAILIGVRHGISPAHATLCRVGAGTPT